MRVGGVGRQTRDLVIRAPQKRASAVLASHGLSQQPILYVDSEQVLFDIAENLGQANEAWKPGGTIGNALYNMGLAQNGLSQPFSLCWFGPVGSHQPRESMRPIDSLRRVGILPYCFQQPGSDERVLCVIAEESNTIASLVIFRGSVELRAEPSWPRLDVVLVGLDSYLSGHDSLREWIGSCDRVAVLIDNPLVERSSLEFLFQLESLGKLGWIFGRQEDLLNLGLLRANPSVPSLEGVEVVATRGDGPVLVWHPAAKKMLSLAVKPVHEIRDDDVGTGDAYAGTFLSQRLLSRPPEEAHKFANKWAAGILQVSGARLTPPADLNRLFGPLIERESPLEDEARLFDRIRETYGMTVLSGGQNGVDQISLRVASDLGLASFGVLPQGMRTAESENGMPEANDWGDAYRIELGSPSFRYRTWANAYFGDGTLLWDFHGGEGSEETRKACRILGRPLLDVGTLTESEIPKQAVEWASSHQVRVVNVAGNRAFALSESEKIRIRKEVDMVLRALARQWAELNSAVPDLLRPTDEFPVDESTHPSPIHLRLGISSAPAVRRLADRFLKASFGIQPTDRRVLAIQDARSGLEIVYARARDLPTMLGNSALDLILCGRDILDGSGVDTAVLLDSGLFACRLVLVTKRSTPKDARSLQRLVIVSQYPELATRLLEAENVEASVHPISGGAETWIQLGLADAAIDTWRTGGTAELNGLVATKVLGFTSLVLATATSKKADVSTRIRDFSTRLEGWLEGR